MDVRMRSRRTAVNPLSVMVAISWPLALTQKVWSSMRTETLPSARMARCWMGSPRVWESERAVARGSDVGTPYYVRTVRLVRSSKFA